MALEVPDAKWFYFCEALWSDPADADTEITWARDFKDTMRPWGLDKAPANFISADEAPARLRGLLRRREVRAPGRPQERLRPGQCLRPEPQHPAKPGARVVRAAPRSITSDQRCSWREATLCPPAGRSAGGRRPQQRSSAMAAAGRRERSRPSSRRCTACSANERASTSSPRSSPRSGTSCPHTSPHVMCGACRKLGVDPERLNGDHLAILASLFLRRARPRCRLKGARFAARGVGAQALSFSASPRR